VPHLPLKLNSEKVWQYCCISIFPINSFPPTSRGKAAFLPLAAKTSLAITRFLFAFWFPSIQNAVAECVLNFPWVESWKRFFPWRVDRECFSKPATTSRRFHWVCLTRAESRLPSFYSAPAGNKVVAFRVRSRNNRTV